MNKEELLNLRDIIEDIKNNGVSKNNIIKIDSIVNDNDIPLVFNRMNINTASFSPNYRNISVNISKIDNWLNEMCKYFIEHFDIKDIDLLKAYLVIYMYRHEIEHTNQYMIGMGEKDSKYEYQEQVYNDLFNILISKKYLVPRPIKLGLDLYRFILYKKNAYTYLLERNATIEGFDLASSIAYLVKEEDIYNCMLDSCNTHFLFGYLNNGDGSLLETYRGLKMMKSYRNLILPDDLSLFERARQGLIINNDERKLVFDSIKSTSKYK